MGDPPLMWSDFYRELMGRPVRPLLLDALALFDAEPARPGPTAIDLGAGDGTETVELLRRGWRVMAIDGEDSAFALLLGKVAPAHRARLETQRATFETMALPPADLVLASYSLPFCRPAYFTALWAKIGAALRPGGRFAGHFFGDRDEWVGDPAMTFHTEAQVREAFAAFAVEFFHERDEDGEQSAGPKAAANGPKHWHVFTVIARKR